MTQTLIKPTESMSDVNADDYKVMERFVSLIYDRNTELSEVNEVRQHLFCTKGRQVENIPPTDGSVIYHLLRSLLVAHMLPKMDLRQIQHLNPADYGWEMKDQSWKPKWTNLPPFGKSRIFIKCACKESKRRCGCI